MVMSTRIIYMPQTEDKFEKYLKTNSGRELLTKHSLDEEGVWRILGEDPNCDFGGHHHEPELDTVSGRLEDVIRYGVALGSFWQWGSGGKFIKQGAPRKITAAENAERDRDLATIARMEEEIRKLKDKHRRS